MGAMDHRFRDLKRLRGTDEIAVRGEIRGRKAYLAAKADVVTSDTLIDGDRHYTVTRVTEAMGHSEVDHLEATIK